MAITVTWSVKDMRRDATTGGVNLVYWECVARDDSGVEGIEGGKLVLTPDADAADFVAYEDLTEEVVLSWVYDSIAHTDDDGNTETAQEAKTRVEEDRKARVTARLASQSANARGVPWETATEELQQADPVEEQPPA